MLPDLQQPRPELAEALALHARGRLREAEACYARILVREPKNIMVRYQLGLARLQRGELDSGIAAMKQALKIMPDHVEARFDLAHALGQQGRHAEALPHFRRVTELRPDAAEAWFYLGMTLCSLQRQAEALPHLERAIVLRPDLAEAHHNLASALSDLGRDTEAAVHFERALALRPSFPEALTGLGNVLCRLHRHQEGVECYKRAILLKPDFAQAYKGWGAELSRLGEHQAARECYKKALALQADDADAMALLGDELSECSQHGEALAQLERAFKLKPQGYAQAALGATLFLWGRYAEGRRHLEQAIARSPHTWGRWSRLLFNMHYVPNLPAEELASLHRQWAEKIESSLQAAPGPFANSRDPGRPLRIGFVSGDLRRHPVGYFMADLLANIDRGRFHLHAYANQVWQDELTARIRPSFRVWRDVTALGDEQLAARIREDAIDILVDLSGHTSGNRLPVFALKPAPVQVSYLGYFNTTGLQGMDYILGNRWLLPEAEEGLYSEKPWRLPDAHLCFTPPDLDIEPGPLPALQTGSVTFGCFNKIDKVNEEAVACWAWVLHAVPGSRLFLKTKALADTALAAHVLARFAAKGVGADRLILEGNSPYREYLESYRRVDIALDPFPYNGGTTSVEALWMGVPVLAMKGDRYVSHMGESILHSVAMAEWIAVDTDDYVAKAAAFAHDLPALAALRGGLRGRLLASPVCDAPRFARNLEDAFRGMWRQWCFGAGVDSNHE
jgi:predicted O-linked N-acetylglucosamine transferase (SPINDLY family)